MHTLEFNHETHQYFVDGRELPSVTTVLKPLSSIDKIPADVLARAAQFGQHVHTATEYHDKGTLELETLDGNLAPYVRGWEKFRVAHHLDDFTMIERRVFSLKYGYAGTLDRLGVWMIGKKKRAAIFDIKTGVISPTFGPQLAAYAKAIEEMYNLKIDRRFTVQLNPNNFKLIPHIDKQDFNIFMSCLNVYKFNRDFKG